MSKSIEHDFASALLDLARAWRNKNNERLKPLGLSQSTWVTLLALGDDKEGVVQSELARRLNVEGPTLVRILDRLEKEGLVERRGSVSDRRSKHIVISKSGKPVIQKVKRSIDELRDDILSVAPETEIRAAAALLRKLREKLDRV